MWFMIPLLLTVILQIEQSEMCPQASLDEDIDGRISSILQIHYNYTCSYVLVVLKKHGINKFIHSVCCNTWEGVTHWIHCIPEHYTIPQLVEQNRWLLIHNEFCSTTISGYVI